MSTIDRVVVHEFEYPTKNLVVEQLQAGSVGTQRFAPGLRGTLKSFAVRVFTVDGLQGEFVPYMGATATALAETVKLAPRLLGRNAFEREGINLALRVAARSGDGGGVGVWDIALWDLAGKAVGQSIGRLLGGFKSRLPTYVSTWRGDRHGGLDSIEAFCAFAESCADRGIRGYKVHSWIDVDTVTEVALVKALGERLQGRIKLMLDPACIYETFQQGYEVGLACDDAGFLWLEDPFVDIGRSTQAHKRLREKIKTPLVQGERIRTLEGKLELLLGGGTDALRADPELDYGITGLMKAAALAEAFGMDIEVANGAPPQRHCISAIRNTTFYEICNVGPQCPNATPPIYLCGYDDQIDSIGADGCVEVPRGAGLGVTYDWTYIERNTVSVHDYRLGTDNQIAVFVQ